MTTAETAWTEAMRYENRHDPYRFFDELRQTPVVQVADRVYVVTGYRELLQLAHDPHVSSDISRSPLSAQPGAHAQPDVGAEHMQAYGREASLIVSDPAKHDKQRRQVMRHFAPPHSPHVIPDMAAGIQSLCDELLDNVIAGGGATFDVVDDYAYPVPVAVICQILGVPLKDEPTFHGWIFDFMVGTDMGPDAKTEEGQARKRKGQESSAALTAYMAELIEGFLTEPQDCVLSKLVNDTDGPDGPMTPQEAAANAMLLLIAGHDSTVNTIAHCVLTLLRNPESIELLREKRELIPKAIEEVLRLQSAVQFFPSRSVTADIAVGGTIIPAGSAVHLLYGAANRDPKRFPDPETFDVHRPDNEHVGWGRGVHSCMGGPLARLEVNIALETFLRRVENPRLVVDPPPYRVNQVFRGPLHLEVEFDRIAEAR
ncbi:cytochrome P450 [Mycolicibacterium psychrotolerans]|uniref:Steroid C26-monooxygenase n=1 Tax=Mycolicibacterium psychrotolerans TaxID=216929 RepID=A0A7I7MFG3_9MYCO|nr:cytochrome P450 [Mycolicibacterium psychrotolerans]BBX70273.1 cytochrome P450 [Mycolicibacterium psychrotolerans]